MRLDDPQAVRAEYASERGLEGRRAAYRYAVGPDVPGMAFDAVAEARPGRVLEVGCGPGELAARIKDELAAGVVAVDISPRMVELARGRGVDARLGDVQELEFEDTSFDCAVAAWMLYHVPDVDRALSELARILRDGGRLVAVTNRSDHLREIRDLLGSKVRSGGSFPADHAEPLLRRHFRAVEARDATNVIRFPDRAALVAYVEASITLFGGGEVPEFEGPFEVHARPVVFVAET